MSSVSLSSGAWFERVRTSPRFRRALALLILAFIAATSFAVYLLPQAPANLAPLGYVAVFVSTLVAGMAIMVPGVNVVVFVAGRSMGLTKRAANSATRS